MWCVLSNTNGFVDVYIKSLEEFNRDGEIVG